MGCRLYVAARSRHGLIFNPGGKGTRADGQPWLVRDQKARPTAHIVRWSSFNVRLTTPPLGPSWPPSSAGSVAVDQRLRPWHDRVSVRPDAATVIVCGYSSVA